MIRHWSTVIGLVLLAAGAAAQEPEALTGHTERLSYALGMNYWYRLRDQSVEVDPALFIRGFRDARAGGAMLLGEAELRTVLDGLQADLRQRQLEQRGGAQAPARDVLRDIQVAFKLDPHLTRSLYMGDRWVSPPIFTGVRQQGDTYTLEARASGIDAGGGPVRIRPEWIPSDPEMVAVMPAGDAAVHITVTRPGDTTLKVAAQGVSRELFISATDDGTAMQVVISR